MKRSIRLSNKTNGYSDYFTSAGQGKDENTLPYNAPPVDSELIFVAPPVQSPSSNLGKLALAGIGIYLLSKMFK